MAISKVLLVTIVLISLLLVELVEADDDNQMVNKVAPEGFYTPAYAPTYTYSKLDCGAACEGRCRLSSRQKMCFRACGTCCTRCNCVPPGTSGNQEVCPCYRDMLTHGGRPKCP
ncbi:Snakin-2 [Capsicum chinense]|nr:Snakin-2 [Capsicum chinense]